MKKALLLIIGILIILPLGQVLAVGTDYRYTGKPYDANTNLYYYGQRYYDPMSGRFTQPDPVSNNLANPQKLKQSTGQELQKLLQNPQALNSYSYTVNNPVRYIDPTGEWWKEFLSGKQSWSSFQAELGEASMYVNPVMSKAIDHPYITGALSGAAAGLGLVFAGLAAGTTPWQLATAGSIASPVTIQLAQKVDNFLSRNKISLDKFSDVGKNYFAKYGGEVNKNLLNNLYKEASKTGIDEALIQAQKSINSFYYRIGEHINKYNVYKVDGYVSKPLSEIVNSANSIKTLEKFINDNLR